MVFAKTVTSNSPAFSSPLKIPFWLSMALFALIRMDWAVPEKGMLMLQSGIYVDLNWDIICGKQYPKK